MMKPPKSASSLVLTANRLTDGAVVYRGAGLTWVDRLEDATIFTTKAEGDAALEGGLADVVARQVAGPYLFEVETDAKGTRPRSVREIIRAAGPTVRVDLGKQAA